MIEILVALIEKMAIIAISMFGMEYTPAPACPTTEATGQLISAASPVYMLEEGTVLKAFYLEDCVSALSIPAETQPYVLTSHVIYES